MRRFRVAADAVTLPRIAPRLRRNSDELRYHATDMLTVRSETGPTPLPHFRPDLAYSISAAARASAGVMPLRSYWEALASTMALSANLCSRADCVDSRCWAFVVLGTRVNHAQPDKPRLVTKTLRTNFVRQNMGKERRNAMTTSPPMARRQHTGNSKGPQSEMSCGSPANRVTTDTKTPIRRRGMLSVL